MRHKEDNLAGDLIDPTSNNRLHCVLGAVIISSEPFETTSTGSFIGDRAQAEDNLTCATIDPHRNTRPHSVLKFLRSWLPLELAVQHQKKGDLDELSGVHLDSGKNSASRCSLLPVPLKNRELDRPVHARLGGSRISRRMNDGGQQDIRADARFLRCFF